MPPAQADQQANRLCNMQGIFVSALLSAPLLLIMLVILVGLKFASRAQKRQPVGLVAAAVWCPPARLTSLWQCATQAFKTDCRHSTAAPTALCAAPSSSSSSPSGLVPPPPPLAFPRPSIPRPPRPAALQFNYLFSTSLLLIRMKRKELEYKARQVGGSCPAGPPSLAPLLAVCLPTGFAAEDHHRFTQNPHGTNAVSAYALMRYYLFQIMCGLNGRAV